MKPRTSVMDLAAGQTTRCPYCWPEVVYVTGNEERKAHNRAKHPLVKGKTDGRPTRHGKIHASLFRPSQECRYE